MVPMEDRPSPVDSAVQPHACWSLLRQAVVGRLAVSVADRPEIFPINFVVDHGTILFRTAKGTKLAGAVGQPQVAFEADGLMSETGEAWSVVIKGRAELISRVEELIDSTGLPLYPWHEADKNCFVRITPDEITGRLFRIVDQSRWASVIGSARRSAPE
jgi:uncharacterized protein